MNRGSRSRIPSLLVCTSTQTGWRGLTRFVGRVGSTPTRLTSRNFKKIGPVDVQHPSTVAFNYFDDQGEVKTVYLRRPKQEQADATKAVIDARKAVMEKYH